MEGGRARYLAGLGTSRSAVHVDTRNRDSLDRGMGDKKENIVERAPTARSSCKDCGQKIEKDALQGWDKDPQKITAARFAKEPPGYEGVLPNALPLHDVSPIAVSEVLHDVAALAAS